MLHVILSNSTVIEFILYVVFSPSGITTPPPIGTFTTAGTDVLDMPVDPNEPTYCLCHQVCVSVCLCMCVFAFDDIKNQQHSYYVKLSTVILCKNFIYAIKSESEIKQ